LAKQSLFSTLHSADCFIAALFVMTFGLLFGQPELLNQTETLREGNGTRIHAADPDSRHMALSCFTRVPSHVPHNKKTLPVA
jgi:hypothetical protein